MTKTEFTVEFIAFSWDSDSYAESVITTNFGTQKGLKKFLLAFIALERKSHMPYFGPYVEIDKFCSLVKKHTGRNPLFDTGGVHSSKIKIYKTVTDKQRLFSEDILNDSI